MQARGKPAGCSARAARSSPTRRTASSTSGVEERGTDGKRRQVRQGGYPTEREALKELIKAREAADAGAKTSDRDTLLRVYLDRWLEWKTGGVDPLKPRTADSYRVAIELYYKPALGHKKLGQLRDADLQELYSCMKKIGRDESGKSEMLRRLIAARAIRDGKRYSTRPVTDARVRRIHALIRSALGDAQIPVNPAAQVKLGKMHKVRPLVWSAPRVEHWKRTGEVPSKVMV